MIHCPYCHDTGVVACHGLGPHALPGSPIEPGMSWHQVQVRIQAVFGALADEAETDEHVRMVWTRHRELWLLTTEHKIVPGGCDHCKQGETVRVSIDQHHQIKKAYYRCRLTSIDPQAKGLAQWSFDQSGTPLEKLHPPTCRQATQAAITAASIEPVWKPYAHAWSEVVSTTIS